ncbi:MAG: amino acid-binding protein [Clostridia bacterium]|nr:amino acid-binding protein [Clostridia bacterium]MBQ9774257.1 amino acid-binding protein [Clostridia bacterium]
MIIKQLSVFLENKKGRICAAADVLAQNNINIRALSLADTSNFGILRLIVDRPEEGKKVLGDAGIVVRVTDVLSLTMDDAPGGTLGVLRLLAESGISVEYMYACTGKTTGKAFMIIQAEELEAAEAILRRNGFAQADIDGI